MGKNINAKIARMRVGLRLIDLSLKTSISQSQLSLYENGLRTPRMDHAEKINQVLGEEVFAIQKTKE